MSLDTVQIELDCRRAWLEDTLRVELAVARQQQIERAITVMARLAVLPLQVQWMELAADIRAAQCRSV